MELPIQQKTINGMTINFICGFHWSFVYEDTTILTDIFSSSGCTETRQSLYAATTEQECIDKRGEITGAT